VRTSRATLQRATADLQTEVEARIFEGLIARIARYFSDRTLRKRIILARAAKEALR
jgi:hypothetical protein